MPGDPPFTVPGCTVAEKGDAGASGNGDSYADEVGKDIKRIRLVETTTRFASCSPNGVLSFSWRLVFAPKPVIDYVVAHEVAHLRELHHGPKFWDLVEEICPSYERHRMWLKKEGLQLFRYGSVKERAN